jgi:hypothetical protein
MVVSSFFRILSGFVDRSRESESLVEVDPDPPDQIEVPLAVLPVASLVISPDIVDDMGRRICEVV